MDVRQAALHALEKVDPAAKVAAVARAAPWATGGNPTPYTWALFAGATGVTGDSRPRLPDTLQLDPAAQLVPQGKLPGRPAKPSLVDPRQVPQRAMQSREGRARLMHAVAHIEFNAINLALDACWRFADMPEGYYLDWLRVAAEEAHHFELVCAHLATLDHAYGDFDAHDGLWRMCEVTQHDVLARMALVPRLLEARGLDVTPGMQAKLAQAGDDGAVRVLDVIFRDEVGHVAVGNHWYAWLCDQRGLDARQHMRHLMHAHRAPPVKAPINVEARQRAGFSQADLDHLLASDAHASP